MLSLASLWGEVLASSPAGCVRVGAAVCRRGLHNWSFPVFPPHLAMLLKCWKCSQPCLVCASQARGLMFLEVSVSCVILMPSIVFL